MNKLIFLLVISVLSGSLLAQESPRTNKAQHVRIIQGPEIELARQNLTIIRWTTNNPGGDPVHYGGVVRERLVLRFVLARETLKRAARAHVEEGVTDRQEPATAVIAEEPVRQLGQDSRVIRAHRDPRQYVQRGGRSFHVEMAVVTWRRRVRPAEPRSANP